jgi:parallel beta-helix repeat protein
MTIRTLFAFAAAFALGGSALAGSLTPPPGPVAPTMKTLTEVEPRTAVQSLPGSATALYVISQPGSYYLTGNIQGVAGKHGILVSSGDVTLDLNGFALLGVSGSNDGIRAGAAVTTQITIRNGTIRDWGGSGIYGFGQGTVSDVMAAHNHGLYGITMGAHSIITRCTAEGNAGFAGIGVAYWSTITDCVSFDNSGEGFEAASATILRGNVARNNQLNGIRVENHCTVENNIVSGNLGAGVRATTYASPSNGNRIEGNNATTNGTGIQVDGPGNTVIKNTAFANGTNYAVASGNAFPPILDPASSMTNTNPFANFGW